MGKLSHERGVLAVEESRQHIGIPEHDAVQQRRQSQRCAAAQQQELSGPGHLIFAVALAHQRLRALRHAVEDGRCHQRKVRHDAIGRHSHIARQAQQQEVENSGRHAGGKLPDKAGDAQLAALGQQPDGRCLAHKGDGVVLLYKMCAAYGNAQYRRNGRCQRRTGQTQAHREDEDVVEHHIEQTAAQRRHHGQRGVAVVADEGRHHIVAHKEGGEHQEDAGIVHAQRHDVRIAAHQPQQAVRAEDAHQHERHRQDADAENSIGEIALRPRIPLRPQDGIAGGRAQADHRAEGKDEIIDGQAEVQQGHAVGARRLRNEIGIRQDVARRSQQAENVLGNIFEKLLCQVHEASFLSILTLVRQFSTVLRKMSISCGRPLPRNGCFPPPHEGSFTGEYPR